LKRTVLTSPNWLLLLLVVLTSCSSVDFRKPVIDKQAAYRDRADKLIEVTAWGFVGKISLDDGEQGGSGRLHWDVAQQNSVLDFHGAMGRGAWRLEIGPEGALLREANGFEQTAEGVNALIQDRMGWPIPVDALQWWVRGLAAPGGSDMEELDSEGLLVHLEQFGWNVDFNRYNTDAGLALPVRLDARRDNYRVKLAIGSWLVDTGNRE
jgi:outer membrane lipoprotein LolB